MHKEIVVYIDKGILFSHTKRMKSCHWMDLEGIMLSEISQREKDKYQMISLICGI